MASFQAKIGWKWTRKRQKYKLSFRFVPTQYAIENSKQIAKLRGETVIKTIVLLCSNLTRKRKFQKNRKKFKKYHCGFI